MLTELVSFLNSSKLIFVLLQGTLAARRRAAAVIHGDENLHKVFSELAFRYK